jgi:hypothetical protein
MRAFLLPLVLLVAIGGDVHGQLIPAAPITAQECSRQANAIGPADRTALGWSRLADCGTTGGTALAGALTAARASADSIYLHSLLAVGSRIQDPTLLSTALTVAEDRSAGDAARIMAMLIALAQIDNHNELSFRVTWDQTVRVPWGMSCRLTSDLDAQYGSRTALPSNAASQMGVRLDGIVFATPPNSHAVIDVAKCVRAALVAQTPDSVDPAQITLAYVCGNTFRVTNTSPKWIDVSYAVSHSNEKGDLEVAPNSSEDFEVDIKDTVMLIYLGQTIRQVANAGTSCPP